MNFVLKLAVPAVLASAALGVNAQTIETDYPRSVPAGPVIAAVAPLAPVTGESTYSDKAPYLIQSNAEGPRVDPSYSLNERTLTREEVQAQARIVVQWNPPDRRS